MFDKKLKMFEVISQMDVQVFVGKNRYYRLE